MLDITTIIVCGIVLFALTFLSGHTSGIEGFHNSPFKGDCETCGKRSRRTCSGCKNCGYCLPYKGKGKCVPGDYKGPHFRDDCMVWEYGYPHGPDYIHYRNYNTNPHNKYTYGSEYPFRQWSRMHHDNTYYGNEVFPYRYFQAAYNPHKRTNWRKVRKHLLKNKKEYN